MEIKELGSVAKNFLWVFLRWGLEALGERFPTTTGTTEHDDSEKVIMPMKLILLRGLTFVCIAIGILGFVIVCKAPPFPKCL